MSAGAPIKSEQKKMLEKYNKKRLEFETDVEGHQAEGLVGSLMIDNSNESAALAIKDSAQTTRTDAHDETDVVRPASASAPASEIDAQMAKYKQDLLEKEQRQRQRLEEKEAAKNQRQKEKETLSRAAKQKREEFKESAAGKAKAYLVGVKRDMQKVNDAIKDAAECGMSAGFAREWRSQFVSFKDLLEKHTCDLEAIEGNTFSGDCQVALDETHRTATDLKNILRHFNTSKTSGKS